MIWLIGILGVMEFFRRRFYISESLKIKDAMSLTHGVDQISKDI
jgi:hypothetical protein